MYLVIYSKEQCIGLSDDDKTLLLNDAFDLNDAGERAEEYAKENNIFYKSLDVIDLNNCKSID